jgi:Tol biopolymer transport system component
VPGDTNGYWDVFVKTLATGAIQRVTTDVGGVQANTDTFDVVWSPDGTQVAFDSWASNLVPGDTNNYQDIFLKTLATGAIQRVSTDSGGGQATGSYGNGSGGPAWSPDGTQIAFSSYADNLVPGDTNGETDVFVKMLATGAVQRVSTDSGGGQVLGGSGGSAWSPDGTQIAFTSNSGHLVTGDTNNFGDVFVKTLATGAVQRVSTDSAGGQAANGGSETENSVWSPDGTQIVFNSDADNLVPGDTNNDTDVFVKTLP